MSEKQKKQNDTVFAVLESWSCDSKSEESPQVTLFSNITAAREHLKELVAIDRKNGVHSSHNPEDDDDDWEIINEEDLFHAWSESADLAITFEIVEKIIRETAG